MKTFKNVGELIGNTPLYEAAALNSLYNAKATVLAKLEFFNPAGSVKDRIGWYILTKAEAEGTLKSGSTIIEPTSGNTGIGLAMAARVKGYPIILTMPETMSQERRSLLAAYGAKLVLTEGKLGMAGSVAKAEELLKEIPNSFMPGQFTNPYNWETHYYTTAEEIWRDTDGKIDILVAGMGTGGTITGCAKRLKELKPAIYTVALEPAASPLLTKGVAGPHGLQGIGANFVPAVYNPSYIDEVIAIADDEAKAKMIDFAEKEGMLVGISAGAALAGAYQLAARPENAGKNIVAIIPDSGERYLSMGIFG